MGKTWGRFAWLFALNLVVSLLLSCAIWRFVLGRIIVLDADYLNIDFFNVLGVVFAVIGLMITIYQIAELRSRQEVIERTASEVKVQSFKFNALERYSAIHYQMDELQKRIHLDSAISERKVSAYTEALSTCVNTLNAIIQAQKGVSAAQIIDCGKCVTLLTELHSDAYKVIEERSYSSFKKQVFVEKIGEIIKVLSEHETLLKK